MHLSLGRIRIELNAESKAIIEGWETLFAGWLSAGSTLPPALSLYLHHASRLPALPSGPPTFTDRQKTVDVYTRAPGHFLLHYLDGALVTVSPASNRAEGTVTPAALRRDRLEDVTYTSLAPLLRRHGHYLLHAFAATRDGRALLLVGPSGSGKTTTGLGLLLAGWELLANDVVLLLARDESVYAYPTPGTLTVRAPSLELLPALRRRPNRFDPVHGSYTYTAAALGKAGWAEPARVYVLCFPAVAGGALSALHPEPAATTFARLLGESVDRWDDAALPAHLDLLQQLSEQTAGYRLTLGRDVDRLPPLLTRAIGVL